MFKKQLIISALVVFFSFGLVGAVFAEDNDTSLVGRDEFSFDAQSTPSELSAQNAAINHGYDQDRLVRGGTEAGNFEYRFDAQLTPSELSAQNAAINYEYDQARLVRGETEAGNWEHRFDASTSAPGNAVADKDNMGKPLCSNC